MSEKNLTTRGSFGIVCDQDGFWRETPLLEIDNHGRPTKVCVLSEEEARAKLSAEYGFDYNAIRIEATCWYEATDWNYFKFSVFGIMYEVHNYDVPVVLDSESKRQYTLRLESLPRSFKNGLPEGCKVKVIDYFPAYLWNPNSPEGSVLQTEDGHIAIQFPEGRTFLFTKQTLVYWAEQLFRQDLYQRED